MKWRFRCFLREEDTFLFNFIPRPKEHVVPERARDERHVTCLSLVLRPSGLGTRPAVTGPEKKACLMNLCGILHVLVVYRQ